MKLTNEEVARVFLMYWQAKFVYQGSLGVIRTVMGVTRGWNITDDTDEDISYRIDKCKLLLTPLDKISDEHAIEVAQIFCKLPKNKAVVYKSYALDYVKNYKHNSVIEYLKIKGYAVPLFFGLNHSANGKTAIQLGLAIDKTIIK